ncbi:MAG TPA: tripartite tricarboxylate transporter substrate binding protein [Casimicrobiaceae bacterium]|jgi:tripartite-type tricarboxylate transporter receptor subunit TctC
MLDAISRLRALALVALVIPVAAFGQAWPNKPVRLISPFAAGGGTDAFARPLAQVLSQNLGQQFIVDNRPGAGGTVGADIAAKSAPDGYTFVVGAVHHTIAVSVYSKLPYDLEKDLVPVTMVAMVPSVVVVHPKVPINSIAELIAYAKANPNKLNAASAGNGTSHHLTLELFKVKTGVQINHIPYKGAGPAMQDLVAGQVDLMFDGMGTSSPQIKGGRLRPLAVTTLTRATGFPDIPTLQEAGIAGIDVTTWYALWAPAGTPPEIVLKMQQEVAKAIASPLLKDIWAQNAASGGGNPSPEFAAFVKTEIVRWAEVAKASGARID